MDLLLFVSSIFEIQKRLRYRYRLVCECNTYIHMYTIQSVMGDSSPSTVPSDSAKPLNKIIAAIPDDLQPTYFRNKKTGKADGFAVDIMNEVSALSVIPSSMFMASRGRVD